jgi:hypothetical protein
VAEPPALRLPQDWQKEIPAARALVAASIRHRPALLMQVPSDNPAKFSLILKRVFQVCIS